jgi:hypothetical protein
LVLYFTFTTGRLVVKFMSEHGAVAEWQTQRT